MTVEFLDDPIFGSFEETGLDSATCFSSDGRYGPYGYIEEGDDGMVTASARSEVIWEDVKWGDLQRGGSCQSEYNFSIC